MFSSSIPANIPGKVEISSPTTYNYSKTLFTFSSSDKMNIKFQSLQEVKEKNPYKNVRISFQENNYKNRCYSEYLSNCACFGSRTVLSITVTIPRVLASHLNQLRIVLARRAGVEPVNSDRSRISFAIWCLFISFCFLDAKI